MKTFFKKVKYWMKGLSKKEQKRRMCKSCCALCEHYETCQKELD